MFLEARERIPQLRCFFLEPVLLASEFAHGRQRCGDPI